MKLRLFERKSLRARVTLYALAIFLAGLWALAFYASAMLRRDLLELVSELVEDYDASHYTIEASEPKEVLRYLIETRGMKQGDLAEIVPQSNLSAILAGKRKISATLAGKLGRYFNISPAVFVPV